MQQAAATARPADDYRLAPGVVVTGAENDVCKIEAGRDDPRQRPPTLPGAGPRRGPQENVADRGISSSDSTTGDADGIIEKEASARTRQFVNVVAIEYLARGRPASGPRNRVGDYSVA